MSVSRKQVSVSGKQTSVSKKCGSDRFQAKIALGALVLSEQPQAVAFAGVEVCVLPVSCAGHVRERLPGHTHLLPRHTRLLTRHTSEDSTGRAGALGAAASGRVRGHRGVCPAPDLALSTSASAFLDTLVCFLDTRICFLDTLAKVVVGALVLSEQPQAVAFAGVECV